MDRLREHYKFKNRTTMYYTVSIILGTVAFSYGSVPMYKMVCFSLLALSCVYCSEKSAMSNSPVSIVVVSFLARGKTTSQKPSQLTQDHIPYPPSMTIC
jgi:cytochrome c oxidase assembly protein Cox11